MRTSEVKRFMELWHGDPGFRDAVAECGTASHVDGFRVDFDPRVVRPLCEPSDDAGEPLDPAVTAYLHEQHRLQTVRDRLTQRLGSGNATYAAWRNRQVARGISQSQPPAWMNPHYPFAIELNVGCTIQCDYCCFAAPKLSQVARHAEHAPRFREILTVLGEFFGPAADMGFLYWATDPLDNPDYEKYVETFRECLGHAPRTTTAAWHRNVRRTKRLLALGNPNPAAGAHRFSINSLEQLHLCMERFTWDELADVHLALQHDESPLVKCAAGRGGQADPDAPAVSNTDISGLLINLVERSASLISPSHDLTEWPLGYAIHRSTVFADGDDLRGFLTECERETMADCVSDEWVPCLRNDLRRVVRDGRVTLSTSCTNLSYDDGPDNALLSAVDGQRTLRAIVRARRGDHGPTALYASARRLYADGLFEPTPGAVIAR